MIFDDIINTFFPFIQNFIETNDFGYFICILIGSMILGFIIEELFY